MANKITNEEMKTLFIRLLWSVGFFWIALTLREWVINKYGNGTAFWAGIIIVLFIAYKFELRLPYWIRNGK